MNFRGYLSSIVVVLSFIGVISYQQDVVLPNQEIVLQFSDDQVSDVETQAAIDLVKKQLKGAGVKDIQVHASKKGQLKISYYSDSDIACIKTILSQEDSLALDVTSEETPLLPIEDDQKTYNVQVFEIHNNNDLSLGFAGKLAIEQATENSRFVNPNSYVPQIFDVKDTQRIVKVAHRFHTTEALTIEEACYIIPEVRAGPRA